MKQEMMGFLDTVASAGPYVKKDNVYIITATEKHAHTLYNAGFYYVIHVKNRQERMSEQITPVQIQLNCFLRMLQFIMQKYLLSQRTKYSPTSMPCQQIINS